MKLGQRCRERVIRIPEILAERLERQIQQTSGVHVFAANGSLAHLVDRIIKRAKIPKKRRTRTQTHGPFLPPHLRHASGPSRGLQPIPAQGNHGPQPAFDHRPLLSPSLGCVVIDVAGLAEGGVCGQCVVENETADPKESASEKSGETSC